MKIRPYDKQPHESKKMYGLFKKYLHSSRDLKEFAEKEGYTYRTIITYSSRWNWSDRAAAYDIDEEKKLQEKLDTIFENINKQGLNDMVQFINDIDDLRTDIMQRFRKKEITSSTAIRQMNEYIRCYREAIELCYIHCRKVLYPQEIQQSKEDTPVVEARTPERLLHDMEETFSEGSRAIPQQDIMED